MDGLMDSIRSSFAAGLETKITTTATMSTTCKDEKYGCVRGFYLLDFSCSLRDNILS